MDQHSGFFSGTHRSLGMETVQKCTLVHISQSLEMSIFKQHQLVFTQENFHLVIRVGCIQVSISSLRCLEGKVRLFSM